MCRGRHAFGRGWVGGSSCWAAADDADSSDSCGEFLLPAPADADGLYTQWRVCNNDCSLGEMITCYPQTEDEMLEDVGLTRAAWDTYVTRLYGAATRAELRWLPRIHEVELVYTNLLPLRQNVLPMLGWSDCPSDGARRPFPQPWPHFHHALYYRRLVPPMPAPDHAWVEVTHCEFEGEDVAMWFYMLPGSGVYVNLGTTIAFDDHYAAARHFLGGAPWEDGPPAELNRLADAAKRAGYDSIQFPEHCDGMCGRCASELMLLRSGGRGPCPEAGVELRTGVNASRACECVPAALGSAGHTMCASCASFVSLVQ